MPLILFSALVGIVINQLGFMYAATYATATTISLVLATIPAFAAITASVLGHERIGARHWLGIGVAAVGTALVLQAGPGDLDFTSLRGDLLALLAAASWGIYSALVRPLLDRYSPNRISTVVVCAALPMLAVVEPAAGGAPGLRRGHARRLGRADLQRLLLARGHEHPVVRRDPGAAAPRGPRRCCRSSRSSARCSRSSCSARRVTLLQIAGGVIVVVGIWLTRRRTLVLAD